MITGGLHNPGWRHHAVKACYETLRANSCTYKKLQPAVCLKCVVCSHHWSSNQGCTLRAHRFRQTVQTEGTHLWPHRHLWPHCCRSEESSALEAWAPRLIGWEILSETTAGSCAAFRLSFLTWKIRGSSKKIHSTLSIPIVCVFPFPIGNVIWGK